jgi:hypothetical protein
MTTCLIWKDFMNGVTRCLSQCVNYERQPFLWHIKNIFVHKITIYAVSRWAQVSHPSHLATVSTIFYAIMSYVRQMGWGLSRSLQNERKSAPPQQLRKSAPPKKFMGIPDLHLQNIENSNRLDRHSKAFSAPLVRVWPSLPVLAIASVLCYSVSLRMGFKMPELFRFLGILWIDNNVSECVISHIDNIGSKFFNVQDEALKPCEEKLPGPFPGIVRDLQ